MSLWAVHLVEESPPAGVKPVEWFLLSTMKVTTDERSGAALVDHLLGLEVVTIKGEARSKGVISANSCTSWQSSRMIPSAGSGSAAVSMKMRVSVARLMATRMASMVERVVVPE